jgi:hypothetical protein
VQHDLGKDLVRERAGHDKRRVASGTAQVDKTAISKQNYVVAAGHEVSVDLWLDVGDALGIGLQPRDVDLDIEVSNV